MNIIITIIRMLFVFVSIILFVSSCIRLYRWRKSAFDSIHAYLRNLRYIYPGEKVCIQAPDNPGSQYVCSGKRSKTMVYWEYSYTVEGIEYCKSYFYEDDEATLSSQIRIYYNRKTPKLMYEEGGSREGVIISVVSIVMGTFFLFAAVGPYIW